MRGIASATLRFRGEHIVGMKHLDVLVAFEVAGVESEDVRNAVNLHGMVATS